MTKLSLQQVQTSIDAYINRMPSLSTTMSKVLEICNNPTASANDLNRIISLDPVLTGKVLKLINSAYYSQSEPISSLTRAVIMMGINTVKNLALSSAFIDNISGQGKQHARFMEDFWLHSLSTGVTTKILAVIKGVPPTEREEYFVAGFIHDLGKVPLMSVFTDQYNEILQKVKEDLRTPLYHEEASVFGAGHGHIGTLIAAKWHLSPQISSAIRDHHAPVTASKDMTPFTVLVSAANLMTYRMNPARSASVTDDVMHAHLDRAGIDAKHLPGINSLVVQELDKARIFLELNK
jgi:HD-like signal output (HDOD) protein